MRMSLRRAIPIFEQMCASHNSRTDQQINCRCIVEPSAFDISIFSSNVDCSPEITILAPGIIQSIAHLMPRWLSQRSMREQSREHAGVFFRLQAVTAFHRESKHHACRAVLKSLFLLPNWMCNNSHISIEHNTYVSSHPSRPRRILGSEVHNRSRLRLRLLHPQVRRLPAICMV